MPICEWCGGSYSDEFNFCPFCGRARRENPAIDVHVHITTEDVWETCQIQSVVIAEHPCGYRVSRYYAQAIGPKGIYIACSSPIWNEGELPWGDPEDAFSKIVNDLVLKGWENVATGEGPTTFRRRITPAWYEAEEAEIDIADIKPGVYSVSLSFCARAGGPKGQYVICASPMIKNVIEEALYEQGVAPNKVIDELNEIIKELIEDGWILAEEAPDPWFARRYWRPLDP